MFNNDSKIKRYVFNDVTFIITFIIAIVAAAFSTFAWITSPQRDLELRIRELEIKAEYNAEKNAEAIAMLATIKNNDLAHIQDSLNALKDLIIINQKEILKIQTFLVTYFKTEPYYEK